MISAIRVFAGSLMALSLPAACLGAELTNQAIARATAAIEAAVPRAKADPARPLFHVTSPAQWMNDPNGPIYYKGYYHLFYQLHPFSDGDGPKYWGHVRSRNLAHWEPLPIALWPSSELGEQGVWSGCCTINGRRQPMIFYTSVAVGQSPQTHAEQWAAIGSDDLINWRKFPGNPVLSEELHGQKKIYDWRDPFIFRDGKRTFMVTGGNLNQAKGGEAVVNIYEAQNLELTEWKYRGVLFKLTDPKAGTVECPNFFKLGDRWVLFVSPYGKVQYYVGDFDSENCRFQSHANGELDFGSNFYAPNTMQLSDGRRIVWGWINGFPRGHGWNGCLSVPRLLSLTRDGTLEQSPAPQLSKLRGKAAEWRNVRLERESGPVSFRLPDTNTLEIQAEIQADEHKATAVTIWLNSGPHNSIPIAEGRGIGLYPRVLDCPVIDLAKSRQGLRVHIFVDRSVLEVFINQTICATKIIPTLGTGATLDIELAGVEAEAKLIQAWPMKSIW